jgi:pentapeptide repeat protein
MSAQDEQDKADEPGKALPKWGDAFDGLDEERKQELAHRLWDWEPEKASADHPGPFAGEPLSGLEVFWLTVCAIAGRESNLAAAEQEMRTGDFVEFVTLHPLHLERAALIGARLEGAALIGARLEGAHLSGARLEQADLSGARLERAHLSGAQLEGADLFGARLERANLFEARLERANLSEARLEGADLTGARLERAHLTGARLDAKTELADASLGSSRWWERFAPWVKPRTAALGDVRWSGVGTVNLTQVDGWERIQRLGDERSLRWRDGARQHENVVRAYRQVATQLRAQGMTDVADRFSNRALTLNRGALLRRGRIPQYLGSLFLAILAGYGYRPLRTIFWYLVVIAGFAFGYWRATHGLLTFGLHPSEIQPLEWYEALILSISSFHGRGFFQPVKSLGDPVAILAAMEAVIGLLIEVSFIATFTQRFFGTK